MSQSNTSAVLTQENAALPVIHHISRQTMLSDPQPPVCLERPQNISSSAAKDTYFTGSHSSHSMDDLIDIDLIRWIRSWLQGPAHASHKAASGTRMDHELGPDSPKRRRLSQSPNAATLPSKARLASTSTPWVDEFDDCDSLFPPLAPIPGVPRYRNPAGPTEAQGVGVSAHSPASKASPAGSGIQRNCPQLSPDPRQARPFPESRTVCMVRHPC